MICLVIITSSKRLLLLSVCLSVRLSVCLFYFDSFVCVFPGLFLFYSFYVCRSVSACALCVVVVIVNWFVNPKSTFFCLFNILLYLSSVLFCAQSPIPYFFFYSLTWAIFLFLYSHASLVMCNIIVILASECVLYLFSTITCSRLLLLLCYSYILLLPVFSPLLHLLISVFYTRVSLHRFFRIFSCAWIKREKVLFSCCIWGPL